MLLETLVQYFREQMDERMSPQQVELMSAVGLALQGTHGLTVRSFSFRPKRINELNPWSKEWQNEKRSSVASDASVMHDADRSHLQEAVNRRHPVNQVLVFRGNDAEFLLEVRVVSKLHLLAVQPFLDAAFIWCVLDDRQMVRENKALEKTK